VTLEIHAAALPLFPGALDLVRKGFLSGGSSRTREFLGKEIEFGPGIDRPLQDLLFDSETSGGLLIAVAPEKAAELESGLKRRDVPIHAIGRVVAAGGVLIRVV
jgi:selenide, water dikinase